MRPVRRAHLHVGFVSMKFCIHSLQLRVSSHGTSVASLTVMSLESMGHHWVRQVRDQNLWEAITLPWTTGSRGMIRGHDVRGVRFQSRGEARDGVTVMDDARTELI
jgi:hypothetical protein